MKGLDGEGWRHGMAWDGMEWNGMDEQVLSYGPGQV
jgi:hypothetical protein